MTASLHSEAHDYCPRKRSQGKRHSQTLIALVGRRTDVLFAMIYSRTGTPYSAINRPGNLTGASSLSLSVTHEGASPAAGVRGSYTPRSNLMIVMNALSYFQSISITTRLIFSCASHKKLDEIPSRIQFTCTDIWVLMIFLSSFLNLF